MRRAWENIKRKFRRGDLYNNHLDPRLRYHDDDRILFSPYDDNDLFGGGPLYKTFREHLHQRRDFQYINPTMPRERGRIFAPDYVPAPPRPFEPLVCRMSNGNRREPLVCPTPEFIPSPPRLVDESIFIEGNDSDSYTSDEDTDSSSTESLPNDETEDASEEELKQATSSEIMEVFIDPSQIVKLITPGGRNKRNPLTPKSSPTLSGNVDKKYISENDLLN